MVSELSPQNRDIVRRLVGFFEYSNALSNLDRLLSQLNEAQIDQLDLYVRRRSEYAVTTNPSTLPGDQRGNLALQQPPYERRGLRWVTALARVELGAMFAGFTDITQPFSRPGISGFDLQEFTQLLLDDARSHYLALMNDPQLLTLTRIGDMRRILSYGRRLIVARSLLRAAMEAGGDQYQTADRQELIAWKQTMDQVQRDLMAAISAYDYAYQNTTTRYTSTTEQTYLSRFCRPIMEAEKRELKAGTATVYQFP